MRINGGTEGARSSAISARPQRGARRCSAAAPAGPRLLRAVAPLRLRIAALRRQVWLWLRPDQARARARQALAELPAENRATATQRQRAAVQQACQRFRQAASGASEGELDAMLAPLPPHAEQHLWRDLFAHSDGDTLRLRQAVLRKQERQIDAGSVATTAALALRLEACLAAVSAAPCGTAWLHHLAYLLRLGATLDEASELLQSRLSALSYKTLQQLRHALRSTAAASLQQQLVASGAAAAERLFIELCQLSEDWRPFPPLQNAIFAASMAQLPGQYDPAPVIALPSGLAVAPGLVAAAQCALPIALDGVPLIDYAGWPALSEDARLARLDAGAQRLLQACAGDHAALLRWTRVLNASLALPFVAAFNNPALAGHPHWSARGSVANFFSAETNLSLHLRRTAGALVLDLQLARQGGQAISCAGQLVVLPPSMRALGRATLALDETGPTGWVLLGTPQFYVDAGPGHAD